MQQSVVILLGIFAFGFAVWRTYKLFTDFDSFEIRDDKSIEKESEEKNEVIIRDYIQ
ncbi:hypothetical protein [Paludibacter sp. 221]|uniref:hypothetical protein n=1 Tax=Paludibacter sp. 221 TaxID=2302939 RepID=UPI0013D6DB09|nr:hypothetical protein [Paludibacter sp. 221]